MIHISRPIHLPGLLNAKSQAHANEELELCARQVVGRRDACPAYPSQQMQGEIRPVLS